jgi:predicted DsbA family dithiol-disulfide isomerase
MSTPQDLGQVPMINPNVARISGKDDPASPAMLHVDIIADLVCPWCYLGKRRLDDALLAVHGPSVVSWYPFQLNPAMPETGMPFDEYLAARFGDPGTLQPALAQLTAAGAAEGIAFRFDRITHIPNTLNAHRVMKLAESEGISTSGVAENMLRGFFEEGLDISQRDVLVDIGCRSGLSAARINRTLDDETTRQSVLSQEAQVRRGGVTGVPDFLINKRLFVIGAQSTESLVNVFDRAMFGEESDLPVSATVH